MRRQAREKQSKEKLNWKFQCFAGLDLTYYEDAQATSVPHSDSFELGGETGFGYGEQASGNFATTSQIRSR